MEVVLKSSDFMIGQESPFSSPEVFISKKTDAHAAKFFDGMADRLEHVPDLLIPPLMQRHFIPGIVASFERLDLACGKPLVIDVRSAAEPLQIAVGRQSSDLDVVDLRDNAGLRHEFRELTVIREDDQTFRAKVEPPHGIDAFLHFPFHVLQNSAQIRSQKPEARINPLRSKLAVVSTRHSGFWLLTSC